MRCRRKRHCNTSPRILLTTKNRSKRLYYQKFGTVLVVLFFYRWFGSLFFSPVNLASIMYVRSVFMSRKVRTYPFLFVCIIIFGAGRPTRLDFNRVSLQISAFSDDGVLFLLYSEFLKRILLMPLFWCQKECFERSHH